MGVNEDPEAPEALAEGVIECEACSEILILCRCQGRCGVCLQWRLKCKCRGNMRRRGKKNARNEWLCFECDEPLDYCQCANRVYENLARGILGIKDPKKRRRAAAALVALVMKWQQQKINSGGAPIDFSGPGRTPRSPRTAPARTPRRVPRGGGAGTELGRWGRPHA